MPVKLRKWIPALALVLILLGWLFFFGGIQDTVTVEAGGSVTLLDFGGAFLKSDTDLATLPLSEPGEYPVTIRSLWRKFDCRVIVVDTVAPTAQVQNLTAFRTQLPAAEDFLLMAEDATTLTVSYATAPDENLPGTQIVDICVTDLCGNETVLPAELTLIFDTMPPEIAGAEDQRVYLGTVLDLSEGITVTDDLDKNARLAIDAGGLDWQAAGVYPVIYRAEDACGNKTLVAITVTVIEDVTPPQIMGVTELSMYIGSTIAYRKSIIITDDTDPVPKLAVDSSKVDLSRPGTYPVIYTATDCVGNTTTRETSITVKETPKNYVEESVIWEAADKILAKILKDGMTTKEQVKAIYKYLDRNCSYVNTSDKSDWMQAAYKLIKTQRGDCFSFYAFSRLMFERLGIPNLTVRRIENPWRTGNHWWNMVSLDGGETWYHYDSTPHLAGMMETCLVTDTDLDRFNQSAKGYYYWDRDAYPATPRK